jgi:hypothetical protein
VRPAEVPRALVAAGRRPATLDDAIAEPRRRIDRLSTQVIRR